MDSGTHLVAFNKQPLLNCLVLIYIFCVFSSLPENPLFRVDLIRVAGYASSKYN